LPFILDTDASDFGIGAVLSQEFPEGHEPAVISAVEARLDADARAIGLSDRATTSPHRNSPTGRNERPIAYFSKRLSPAQKNYSVSERELLALVLAAEHFKFYLSGAHWWARSDHEALSHFKTATNLSPRLARWRTRMENFDFSIVYRKGKDHGNADTLSRMNHSPESEPADADGEVIIFIVSVTTPPDEELFGSDQGDFQDRDELLVWLKAHLSSRELVGPSPGSEWSEPGFRVVRDSAASLEIKQAVRCSEQCGLQSRH
jgi:hypothetical protein